MWITGLDCGKVGQLFEESTPIYGVEDRQPPKSGFVEKPVERLWSVSNNFSPNIHNSSFFPEASLPHIREHQLARPHVWGLAPLLHISTGSTTAII
jgi:hypothetical protein